MNKTKIQWTERTWNPVTGCTKRSEGCRNCYAEVMAKRLQGMGQKRYANGFQLTLHPELLNEPKEVKEPSMKSVDTINRDAYQKRLEDFLRKVHMEAVRNEIEYENSTYIAIDFYGQGKKCDSCDICKFGICDAAWCSDDERCDGRNVVFIEKKNLCEQ